MSCAICVMRPMRRVVYNGMISSALPSANRQRTISWQPKPLSTRLTPQIALAI